MITFKKYQIFKICYWFCEKYENHANAPRRSWCKTSFFCKPSWIMNYKISATIATAPLFWPVNLSPTTKSVVFPDERRLALLDRLDDFKTKTSGQVPTINSPQFDPALYIDFEDQIKTLEGLEGTQLKEAINDIEKNLRIE